MRPSTDERFTSWTHIGPWNHIILYSTMSLPLAHIVSVLHIDWGVDVAHQTEHYLHQTFLEPRCITALLSRGNEVAFREGRFGEFWGNSFFWRVGNLFRGIERGLEWLRPLLHGKTHERHFLLGNATLGIGNRSFFFLWRGGSMGIWIALGSFACFDHRSYYALVF